MECGEGRDCLLLSLRTPPTSCSSQHAQCLCSLLLAAPTPELLSGFIGSGRLPTTLATAPAVVCVWGSPYSGTPPLLELPFSQCDLFPSLAILGLSWEETSVMLPGNRKGVMTSRCAGKHPAPPPGAARPSGSVGAGRPLSPLSDTGCKECPGLNGPCVKMWDGGQSPSTPLKAGPEQEAAHGLGCTVSELSPYGDEPSQTLPGVSSLYCSPSPSLHVPTARPVELGLHRHTDVAG